MIGHPSRSGELTQVELVYGEAGLDSANLAAAEKQLLKLKLRGQRNKAIISMGYNHEQT